MAGFPFIMHSTHVRFKVQGEGGVGFYEPQFLDHFTLYESFREGVKIVVAIASIFPGIKLSKRLST
jgi:hypothetical protein